MFKYGDRIVKGIAVGIGWEQMNPRKNVKTIMIMRMMVKA